VIGAGVALLWVTEASAASAAPAVAQPEGWIGTTTQWAQGLGFGLALLTLILLVIAWRGLRRGGSVRTLGGMLFLALTLLPLLVMFVGYLHGFQEMETVQACGGCHVMTPFVNDLKDPKSEALAAVHYKNRYIQDNHCYSCHTDLRHVRNRLREAGRRPPHLLLRERPVHAADQDREPLPERPVPRLPR
jgi:hypothetical protein